MRSVLVLGGGISGLSVAMELARDFEVIVVEKRPIVGGKARTWTDPEFDLFREHSFHAFHESYANLFDAMRRIPFRDGKSVYDNLRTFVDARTRFRSYSEAWDAFRRRARGLPLGEKRRLARDAFALLKILVASDERMLDRYTTRAFAEMFEHRDDGSRGLLFDVLRGMSEIEYSADRVNPDVKLMVNFIEKHFLHGPPGLGWKTLVGPTSEAFLDPWRAYLESRGVRFELGREITGLDYDEVKRRVVGVRTKRRAGEETLTADYYVSALTSDVLLPLVSSELFEAAPSLHGLREVRRVWNNGVLVYTKTVQELRGGNYVWHPWRPAVTSYATRWSEEFRPLSSMGGPGARGEIRDVLSYSIRDWEEDGTFSGKRARESSPAEIHEELCRAAERDPSVIARFDRRDHVAFVGRDGTTHRCFVDEALHFGGDRFVSNDDTVAHVPPGASYRMPPAKTAVANFVLASTHCKNSYGCGDSMESANETGRRAANVVLEAAGHTRRVAVFEGRTEGSLVRALGLARKLDRALLRVGI